MPVEVSMTRSGWLMRMPPTVASPRLFAWPFALRLRAALRAARRPSSPRRFAAFAVAGATGCSRPIASRLVARAGPGRPSGACGRPASIRRTTPRRPASARPSGAAHVARLLDERRASRGRRVERLLQRASVPLVEAAADAAGDSAAAVLVVDAEQERADAGARALRIGEAADHELLALRALELDPGRAAPRT